MQWLFQRDLISSSSCCNTPMLTLCKHCRCKFKLIWNRPLATMALKKIIHRVVILLNNWDHQDSIRWFAVEWPWRKLFSLLWLSVWFLHSNRSNSAYNYIFSSAVASDNTWNEVQPFDIAYVVVCNNVRVVIASG